MADEVVANRKVAGNGLDKTGVGRVPGSGSVEEATPLKPRYGDPTAPFSEDEEVDISGNRKPDGLTSCARRCGLTPKRALLYLIVCGVIILILLIAIFLMLALWPATYSSDVCQRAECHLLSAQILSQMNDSVSPCENFWEFSCGGWLLDNPIPPSRAHWSAANAEELRVKDRIRMLINTEPERDELNSVDVKVKRFYRSCMSVDYIEVDKDRGFKTIIDSLGGWEVLRTFRQNEFNFRRVLQTLQEEYRVSPFFQIEVVADPRTPTRGIIRISPAGLSLPDRSYYFKQKDSVATAFHYYAKDIVQLLGATSDAAVKFADDIFGYEKRIATITPDSTNYTDPVATFDVITVAKLRSKSNTIFWDELLMGIFPQGQVNDLTEVLVPSLKYLEDISNVISATDRQILNNYLMWHLTLKYSIYLNKPYTDLFHIYQKETLGIVAPQPRWEFCVDETMKVFPHAINGLLSHNCPDRDGKREKVQLIFENVKTAFRTRLAQSTGIPQSWINVAQEKLRLMSIQIGTPVRNSSVLVDLYLPIVVQRDYFFKNVISGTNFHLKEEQIHLASLTKDATTLWAAANHPFQVTYIPSANKVVVPEAFLQNSLLGYGRNHIPNVYAWLGVQLGESIGRAFGPEDGLFLPNGVLMDEHDTLVEDTRNLIESKRTCISSFFTSIRLDDAPYVDRTSLHSLLHLGGIQMAFDALKSLNIKSLTLPSLQKFSIDALYFIAYVQSQCSSSTIQFHDLEHNIFRSLSHDHRTRGLLRQMVGFTQVMSCSKSSEMYADFTCGYFI